ncbi:GNAT family N-acetyltransferase [Snodgrassella alvi]|uniref:GNAT family N-acetyltransferase n=1 Tax=Snodgrassella alvi TaxID=1196083 RepID=A0ABD7Z3X1_9NEIS|nr:GNAT family N-acetyltransferase [Snodgrassella alvi]WLS98324.1 GNAT family N-acetyltransferase [Snodgrassella alvi]
MQVKRIDKSHWQSFSKYHYLSHFHIAAAKCYGAYIENELVGFCSVMRFPHPKLKNLIKVHRLVVYPDYQGLGIGMRLLEIVADNYIQHNQFGIVTSSPQLIKSLNNSPKWGLITQGRNARGNGKINGSKRTKNTDSRHRYTTSWRYKG